MLKGIELDAAVAAVKQMARENYDKAYGYRVITDSMDDADIAAMIEECRSTKSALATMSAYAQSLKEGETA